MSIEDELQRLGFRYYANVGWVRGDTTRPPRMTIQGKHDEVGGLGFALYAFVIGGHVARLGKYEPAVHGRIATRAEIINAWFSEGKATGSLSKKEPLLWQAWFEAFGDSGTVWCETGENIGKNIGLPHSPRDNAAEYLERVEMRLVADFYPPLNMDTRRLDRLPPMA